MRNGGVQACCNIGKGRQVHIDRKRPDRGYQAEYKYQPKFLFSCHLVGVKAWVMQLLKTGLSNYWFIQVRLGAKGDLFKKS